MKSAIYGVAVACFVVAGTLDFRAGRAKEGVLALTFAFANACIFLWK